MFLVDTNVVSEFRKIESGRADGRFARWARNTAIEDLYVSVITLMELEIGILRIDRKDQRQGLMLRSWLEIHVRPEFQGRTLSVDAAVARRCAQLHVPDPQPDRDALIAATALVHDLTVVTRNVQDFRHAGLRLLNPWAAQP
jgi:predicted nucleic acid-binding protein